MAGCPGSVATPEGYVTCDFLGQPGYNPRTMSNNEDSTLPGRLARYARVGTSVGTLAARAAGARMFGLEVDDSRYAGELAAALGGLKGPIMKVAQLLSTIPEALPAEYAAELQQLQSQAPPMGSAFVRRRMAAELGPDWEGKFAKFDLASTASASLGQVHKALSHDGARLAVKLQYPDMQSAVDADVAQLGVVFAIHRRMRPAVDTSEILAEVSERLKEELDYRLEARHMALYGAIFANDPLVRVPTVRPDLSTGRLLAMEWLDGTPLMSHKTGPLEERNAIARAMFRAWWYPFSHFGCIHGDPHLGNYTVRAGADGRPAGLNLLDYGCIRTFAPRFVQGVLDLYHGLRTDDRARVVHAYESWGFKGLSNDLIDVLNIWARFIYGPLLDDRERRIAEDVAPGEYGRKEAFLVARELKAKGPVRVPREFVFMDRAAIGLGGVFLHLDARQNWYRFFNDTIEDFDLAAVERRQRDVFEATGVPVPR